MNRTNTLRYCLAGALSLCLGAACAATPRLWDGNAATPETLRVPGHDMVPGSLEYVSLAPVHFETGKATISHSGQQALDAAADYLLRNHDIKRILVEGHADEAGSVPYNDDLSDRRATIVRNYLTIKGVDPALIELSGQGELRPVDQNWTRDGRRRNRHVSIHVLHWQR